MLLWSVIWCVDMLDGVACLLVLWYLCLGIPAVCLGYRVVWSVPIMVGGYALVFVMGLVFGGVWLAVCFVIQPKTPRYLVVFRAVAFDSRVGLADRFVLVRLCLWVEGLSGQGF